MSVSGERKRGAPANRGRPSSRAGSAAETPLQIGRRLRKARIERGLTLEKVANEAGLTKSFISQVEKEQTSASVASLHRICTVLGIRIASLLEAPGSSVLRRSDRTPMSFGGAGVVDYVLTPSRERALQVFETHIEPGGSAGDELFTADVDVDLAYVLRGRLEMRFADRTIVLGPGDALTFSPREPHTWRNPSTKRSAVVILAMTPAGW